MDGLMKTRMNVSCPICGSVFHPSLEDLRLERTVRCPAGHQVKLIDRNDGAQKLDRSLDTLTRQLRRAGFKITIRRR